MADAIIMFFAWLDGAVIGSVLGILAAHFICKWQGY
jgi:hypothetical protein